MPADTPAPLPRLTAFAGQRNVAAGKLHAVAQSLTALVTRDPDAQILIVDDASGSQVDLNLHGSLAQVLQRLPRAAAAQAMPVPAPAPARTAGRPKLGVVAREITLLPRHWAWLAIQPGGASVALRKRVEHAQRGSKAQDEQRQARDAAYQPTSRGLPVHARAGRRCPRFRRGQPRPVRRAPGMRPGMARRRAHARLASGRTGMVRRLSAG